MMNYITLSFEDLEVGFQLGLDCFKTHEDDTLARDHAPQTWNNTCIESSAALFAEDLFEAV